MLCQQQQILTSILREGNYTCQGEEVVFTCTVSDSTLPVLVIGWRSDEYIGPDALLQFTTDDMQGENRTSMINGNVTAILTRNTNDNGVLMVESTLRIVATVPSQVTCGVTNRVDVSSTFSVSGNNLINHYYTHNTHGMLILSMCTCNTYIIREIYDCVLSQI